MMLGVGHATRIHLAVDPADMRKSFEGLSGLIRGKLQEDPLSGHLFLFCNKARNRLKMVFWDGTGLWVCAKRLERGRFSWPSRGSEDGTGRPVVVISQEDLILLTGGIEMSRLERKPWWRREALKS